MSTLSAFHIVSLEPDLSALRFSACIWIWVYGCEKHEKVGRPHSRLIELNLRKKYGLNIVATKKNGEVSVSINPEQPLDKNTNLIVIANTAKLNKLQ